MDDNKSEDAIQRGDEEGLIEPGVPDPEPTAVPAKKAKAAKASPPAETPEPKAEPVSDVGNRAPWSVRLAKMTEAELVDILGGTHLGERKRAEVHARLEQIRAGRPG